MEFYLTLDNYHKRLSVFINKNYVYIFRVYDRDKIWEGFIQQIFIGKSYINENNNICRYYELS